ncbi:MAG: sugar phosphate isomerase/epimerase [Balneolaceae bacterium]
MGISRRKFLKNVTTYSGGLLMSSSLLNSSLTLKKTFDFKISLAEWCLNKEIFSGEIDHLDFPIIAKRDYEIEGVEYVSQFFPDKATDKAYLKELKMRADDHGVTSVLIMIDNEGYLSSEKEVARKKAVQNHYKWVEAAKYLGCHSIRINLHGAPDPVDWKLASIESLSALSEFGSEHDVNVIVENHGSHSSHGGRLADVLKQVDSEWAGTLPDFGNFCVARENGELWGAPCIEQYDPYQGTKDLMPFAKGVSAKTFDFEENGDEATLDYMRLFKIVKDSGFNNGWVGIEYEGEHTSPQKGILLTKKLLEKVRAKLA